CLFVPSVDKKEQNLGLASNVSMRYAQAYSYSGAEIPITSVRSYFLPQRQTRINANGSKSTRY
ncbi:MAG: hypothetical protein, partial [Olavius algarvensis Gamma 1 endosymbiont]